MTNFASITSFGIMDVAFANNLRLGEDMVLISFDDPKSKGLLTFGDHSINEKL